MFSTPLLIAIDSIAALLAFFATYFIRNSLQPIQPLTVYLPAIPISLITLIFLIHSFGLYSLKKRLTPLSESYSLLQVIFIWELFLMSGAYLSKTDYSRAVIISLFPTTIILLLITRYFVRLAHRHLLVQGRGVVRVLIVGQGRVAREIATRLKRYSPLGVIIVKLIPKSHLGRLYSLLSKLNINEVYLADSTIPRERLLNLIAACPTPNVKFKLASNIFDLATGMVDIANLESIPALDLTRPQKPVWLATKRGMDLCLSSIFLLLSLPFWLLIIVLIKLDSPGPAIIHLSRVGLMEKIFAMYKFRTMFNHHSDDKPAPKSKLDRRVTKVGKILRHTSLDELPQLINVLRGEMSLVGPRPEMPHLVKKYRPWQSKRLDVKPGLTGLWQILGRKDLPLAENLEYDFYYINNQSLLLDTTIILKTIPKILLGSGAY